MSSANSIKILPSQELDKSKWDHCILSDRKALIYSCSWYLDGMSGQWCGAVYGDYEAVLPLPFKKKYGVKLVALPPFVQRLDISGVDNREAFARAITKFANVVSFASTESSLIPNAHIRQRTNYVLPLSASYASIFDNYSAACKKNLHQSKARACRLMKNISINEVISLYRHAYGDVSAYTDEHFARLEQMIHSLHADRYHIGGVTNASGQLVYAGLLLDDGRRLYYLLGAPNQEGRSMRATYFFIDAMVQRFAGQRQFFDFEGSDIPGVAKFYQSFSPETEHYYQYYINNYPFPLNKIIDAKLKPF